MLGVVVVIRSAPKRLLWHPSWIPIGGNERHELVLAPVPCFGGPAGQLVAIDVETCSP